MMTQGELQSGLSLYRKYTDFLKSELKKEPIQLSNLEVCNFLEDGYDAIERRLTYLYNKENANEQKTGVQGSQNQGSQDEQTESQGSMGDAGQQTTPTKIITE